jgi:uncharacterized protein DUF3800
MHLVYLDESGNSGMNLNDPAQPVFALCAMVVDESKWQSLERDLIAVLDARIHPWRAIDRFEVHAVDLRTGRGQFRGMAVADRIAFRDAWMDVGIRHGVRLIYRTVEKKPYANWLNQAFGPGVLINPHVAAFAIVARCVDHYLASLPAKPLGMFISDENKEVVADVEKSLRVLRGADSTIRLQQIVEKGFFVDSSKSLPLQLCDLFTLSLKKQKEIELKYAVSKPFDESGIALACSILHTDRQHDLDVIQWLTKQHAQKRSGQGINPRVD